MSGLSDVLTNDLLVVMERQALAFPEGYPVNRHGMRLGIAHLGDAENEAWDEWYRSGRTEHWGEGFLRERLLDCAAIALRMVASLDAAEVPQS